MSDQRKIKDGLVLFYVKDGTVYPVALSEDQKQTFDMLMNIMPQPIRAVNTPIGKAINLKGGKQQ
ncbi:hypothetical protein [Brevibacillus centrosporus]|uniref:hypothetical protein n=1 Tax=Brevibacillus centrosporus TaxID=54910 RepID=UPI002E23A330|nr:hypothetical protein [Brevibacillus centrosporus]